MLNEIDRIDGKIWEDFFDGWDLHSGVEDVVCGIFYYIGVKGWRLKDVPREISPKECEFEVYSSVFGKSSIRKVSVKILIDLTAEPFSKHKQYYCVEITEDTVFGTNKTIFYCWSSAMTVAKVEKQFYTCKGLRDLGNKIAKKQRSK